MIAENAGKDIMTNYSIFTSGQTQFKSRSRVGLNGSVGRRIKGLQVLEGLEGLAIGKEACGLVEVLLVGQCRPRYCVSKGHGQNRLIKRQNGLPCPLPPMRLYIIYNNFSTSFFFMMTQKLFQILFYDKFFFKISQGVISLEYILI